MTLISKVLLGATAGAAILAFGNNRLGGGRVHR